MTVDEPGVADPGLSAAAARHAGEVAAYGAAKARINAHVKVRIPDAKDMSISMKLLLLRLEDEL